MPDEAAPMQKPSWLVANVSFGNIIILVTGIFAAGIAWAQVSSLGAQISDMKRDQAEWRSDRDKTEEVRRTTTDATLTNLLTRTNQIDSLIYRVGKSEGAIDTMSTRMDRIVEAMQHAVEPLSDKIGTLTTRVEVLAVAIDRISPPPPGKRSDNEPGDGERVMR